jgi:hypothetical protein
MKELRTTRAEAIVAVVLALGVGAAIGVGAQYQRDSEQAVLVAYNARKDRQEERDAAKAREDKLNEIIEQERRHHADALRQRDFHLSAFTARSTRMRNEFETMLADSRGSASACTARADGIAEAVGAILDSIDEGTGLLEEAGRENQRLASENRELREKLVSWQDLERSRHPDRITVTAKRKAE